MSDGETMSAIANVPRVAIIFDNFGPYHIARLSAAAACGMDVTAIEVGGQSEDYAWDRPDSHGLHRVALFPGSSRGLKQATITAAMEQALERAAPDAIAIPGWADKAGLAALRWALRKAVPVVVMSESNEADHGRNVWRELIKRHIVGLCSAALAGGSRAAAYLAALGMPAERISIGYDVIDNGYFRQGAAAIRGDTSVARAALGLPERFFLTCCRLIDKKNIAFLLDALAEYRRRAPTGAAWSLVIAGDGPLRAGLEEQARNLGIADAVHFAGFAQYDALPTYYGLASAFVLPSTTEQWGLVVNEAMAAGLPVLVSERCGCSADLVVDGGNGFTFDPTDRSTLVQRLYDIAHKEDLSTMGQRSTEIVAGFAPDRFGTGLRAAVVAAVATPARPTLVGRGLLSAMLR